MIKLVAFDWNGTILADMQAVLETNNVILKSLGVEPAPMKVLQDRFTIPIVDYFATFGLSRKMLLKNSERDRQLFLTHYEKRASKSRTRANARRVLDYLKDNNIESIILSGHVTEKILGHLKRLKIENYFPIILANSDVVTAYKTRNKQEKLGLYIKSKKINPKEVLVVGDSLEEIELSKELGTLSVAITHGNVSTSRLKAAKPDYLISDLGNLINIIREINSV